jgi:hypothetical protein
MKLHWHAYARSEPAPSTVATPSCTTGDIGCKRNFDLNGDRAAFPGSSTRIMAGDRGSALATRPSVIQPVQFIDRKWLVGKLALRPQLVDEHLTKRRKACELPLFDKREPRFHIGDGTPQAVVGKCKIGWFGHRRGGLQASV